MKLFQFRFTHKKKDSQSREVLSSSLSRTTGKMRVTNLSKEPYITFRVRTTSPTTVCRYSKGTLEGNGKMSNADLDQLQLLIKLPGTMMEKQFILYCFVYTWVFP